jgi:hypothetical protein
MTAQLALFDLPPRRPVGLTTQPRTHRIITIISPLLCDTTPRPR